MHAALGDSVHHMHRVILSRFWQRRNEGHESLLDELRSHTIPSSLLSPGQGARRFAKAARRGIATTRCSGRSIHRTEPPGYGLSTSREDQQIALHMLSSLLSTYELTSGSRHDRLILWFRTSQQASILCCKGLDWYQQLARYVKTVTVERIAARPVCSTTALTARDECRFGIDLKDKADSRRKTGFILFVWKYPEPYRGGTSVPYPLHMMILPVQLDWA